MQLRRAACVIAIVAAALCGGCSNPFAEPMELSLVPGARPQYWFACYTTAPTLREKLRIKGNVRKITLRMEKADESSPDHEYRLSDLFVMEFDDEGSVVRMVIPDGEGKPPLEATQAIEYESVGGRWLPMKCVATFIEKGELKSLTEKMKYDAAGRLTEVRRGADGAEATVILVDRDTDGTVKEVTMAGDDNRVEVRMYDRAGRLLSFKRRLSDSDRPPNEVLHMVWADERHFKAMGPDDKVLIDAELDHKGVLTRFMIGADSTESLGWTFFAIDRSTANYEREAKFDANGNWTELTTYLMKPRNGEPPERVRFMRVTREIEYAKIEDRKPGQ